MAIRSMKLTLARKTNLLIAVGIRLGTLAGVAVILAACGTSTPEAPQLLSAQTIAPGTKGAFIPTEVPTVTPSETATDAPTVTDAPPTPTYPPSWTPAPTDTPTD